MHRLDRCVHRIPAPGRGRFPLWSNRALLARLRPQSADGAVDEAGVRFARPRSLGRALPAAVAAALLLCATPQLARADAFEQDRTPLPAAITDGASTSDASGPSSGGGFARLAVGLIVVVALIFAVRWLVRRSSKAKLPGGGGKLTVVATAPLAANRAVHLVRVGTELVLIGSAEQRVDALRVYDAEESAELSALLDPAAGQFSPLPPSGSSGWPGFVDDLRRRTVRK
jgi:flagellar biogenesis protein FliO